MLTSLPPCLRLALKGSKAVVHSRSSNIYGAVDSDDFYQYLGGTAMAVREVNGSGADTLVADLSNPKSGQTMTLERYMGREMRSRYLNPKWIEAMLKEGYSGARMIRQVTDNLWGWQVTVPEAVDAAKWQEMYEVYVQDREKLGIREKFNNAENLAAYKAIIDRMLTVIDKGYWKAAPETIAQLRNNQAELAPAIGKESATIANRASLQPAPGSSASSQPSATPPPSSKASAVIKGRVLEETKHTASPSHNPPQWIFETPLIGLAALAFILLGWFRSRR